MLTRELVAPNDLEAFWMPFTSNRHFKAQPRLIARAEGMHFTLTDGRRVLDATAGLLGVDLATFAKLALSAPVGAEGLVLVPYLEGERTPDRPLAAGSLHGLRLNTMSPAHLARAAVEGMLCALADGLEALVAEGVVPRRVILVGGGARSAAVREIAPAIFGVPVLVPPPGEYVADGAARQAAWALGGGAEAPEWSIGDAQTYEADPAPEVRERYAEATGLVLNRPSVTSLIRPR